MRIGETIYFDHQATTPVDRKVLETMVPFFSDTFGNPHSVDHSVGWHSASAVHKATQQVAQLIGADADEVIFTSGATESNNLALLGIGRRAAGEKRKRILLSAIEHKSVLSLGHVLRDQFGYTVQRVPVDSSGCVIEAALEEALSEDVLMVSIMAVNNEIGTIQDIARISQIVRNSGAIFHCDAAQAPTAMDMRSIVQSVDLLSLSSHKMYGPQGIGALFIQRALLSQIEPLIYGGGQQSGLRSGTVPVPLCVGMGAAAEICANDQAEARRNQLCVLRNSLVDALMSLPWQISSNGPQLSRRHPGNANICFHGFSARDILGSLQPYLAASHGSACTSGVTEPSHVLEAIGLGLTEADASIRFSLGFGTKLADIEQAVELIDQTLLGLSQEGLTTSN